MVRAIREYILRRDGVQSDETSVRMQLRDGPEPRLKGRRARYLQAGGGSSHGPVMENLGELLRLFADMRLPKTPFGKAMS